MASELKCVVAKATGWSVGIDLGTYSRVGVWQDGEAIIILNDQVRPMTVYVVPAAPRTGLPRAA